MSPSNSYWGFPDGTVAKNPPTSAADARDSGSIPGAGKPPGAGNSNPLQHSFLGNPTDRGAWQATVYGDTKESAMM